MLAGTWDIYLWSLQLPCRQLLFWSRHAIKKPNLSANYWQIYQIVEYWHRTTLHHYARGEVTLRGLNTGWRERGDQPAAPPPTISAPPAAWVQTHVSPEPQLSRWALLQFLIQRRQKVIKCLLYEPTDLGPRYCNKSNYNIIFVSFTWNSIHSENFLPNVII